MDVYQYEFPTNQQTRKFLRLELLFKTVRDLSAIHQPATQRAALFRLVEIIDFFDRNDVKTELLKELDRLHNNLLEFESNPAVDSSKLSYFVTQLEKLARALSQAGRAGDGLRDDEFLKCVRQKWSLGASCSAADSPAIWYFLSHQPAYCAAQIETWLDRVKLYRTSVNVILRLYRESGEFETAITEDKRFQETIDPHVKLIALRLPATLPFIPEVSVGAHRWSLQLIPNGEQAAGVNTEIQFQKAKYRA